MRREVDSIIFDMDGVIFDTERLMLKCWERACAEYDINDIDSIYSACIGTTSKATVKLFDDHYDHRYPFLDIQSRATEHMHEYIDRFGPPVMPFAPELLSSLNTQGFHIALASSTASDLIKKELSKSGLEQYFKVIIGGDMVEHGKPAPDIFLRACRELERNPSDVYVIEDSENGIRAAHAAGTMPIMVPDMITPSKDVAVMCTQILENLEAVKKFLCS